jgi:hypothetical protein
LTRIGNEAFRQCSSLTSMTIPWRVEILGTSCFDVCTELKSVRFPSHSKLVRVEESAFRSCVSLKSFCVPSCIEFIGQYCFSHCSAIETVTFPSDSKLIRIEQCAFWFCVSLTSFHLPSLVESVGRDCFRGCHSLSRFGFSSPSHVRDLMDVRGEVIDIPDSVERLRTWVHLKDGSRHILRFGDQSQLDRIEVKSWDLGRASGCFLGFSARTLKVFRSRLEFPGFNPR